MRSAPSVDPRVAAAGKRELSEEEVVVAALSMCEESGLAGLSMRRLAAELGVTATALYYHVPNKEALLGRVAEVLIEQFARQRTEKHWRDGLRRLLIEENRLFRHYPGLARYLLEHRSSRAAMLWAEAFLAVLLEAGFSEEDAGQAFGRITMLINPLFLLEELPDSETSGDVMMPGLPSMEEQLRAFPSLARVGPHMSQLSFDEMFERNADALVATLEAELGEELKDARRARRTSRTERA
jgi:TetR/AcrR family tetracycline transcriptional repressor